jgi:hypothetical protein
MQVLPAPPPAVTDPFIRRLEAGTGEPRSALETEFQVNRFAAGSKSFETTCERGFSLNPPVNKLCSATTSPA